MDKILEQVRSLIADDAYAASFQSLGQYRSALLSSLASAKPAADQNVEDLRDMLLQRSQIGLAKYGVTTMRDDLSLQDWLTHALEETLDNAVYLRAALRKVADNPVEMTDEQIIAAFESAGVKFQTLYSPSKKDWVRCTAGSQDDVALIAAVRDLLSAPQTADTQGAAAIRNAALQFADEIINGVFEGGDWDGGELQDLAVKYGLLKPEVMQEACGDEECACRYNGSSFPTECYRKTYLQSSPSPSSDAEKDVDKFFDASPLPYRDAERDQVDALRYAWLRDRLGTLGIADAVQWAIDYADGEALDAAIDVARAAQEKQK
jgi:hypothetical protein